MAHRYNHTKVLPIKDVQRDSSEVSLCSFLPRDTVGKNNEFIKWVRENISKKVCNKYVPTKEKTKQENNTGLQGNAQKGYLPKIKGKRDKNGLCHCHYEKSDHTSSAKRRGKQENEEWDPKINLESVMPTDAFGELEFSGYGQRVSKYIRVDDSIGMGVMMDLLGNGWHMKTPNLLISVTGGAKNFTMKPRLKQVFRRGLMKAAVSTGAWITTGGMNAGVMKHVGEAVRDYMVTHGNKTQVVAIGIAPWGCVTGKKDLISAGGMGKWPAVYRIKGSQRRESPLDPNHSHFILVDNGTQNQFGTEITFRATLESAIAHQLKVQSAGDEDVSIPLVCVVLEGGPGTLETVKSAIQNGTPAVIVEGSGRAADVLAFAYANSSEEEVEATDKEGKKHKQVIPIFDDELFGKVKKKICDMWGNKDIDSRLSWVRECLEKRDHMTVFQLDQGDSAKDIDIAILQALLKVNKDKTIDQLRLALAWKRIDIAKNEIFTDSARWDPEELNKLMFTAIVDDCTEFVDLFKENGVNLKEFLTVKCLLKLYKSIPKNRLIYPWLQRKQHSENELSLTHVGYLISDLTGDFYQPLYLQQTYKDIGPEGTFEEPARELFLWSVLNHRLEMAKFFWEEGRHGIAAALTAQKITSSMIEKTEDSELEKQLTEQKLYFEDLAVGVLSECYAGDESQAQHLLVQALPLFGNSTCVELAVEADNRKFLAHAACQSLLSNIWMGHMSQDNGLLRLGLCMILPLLVIPLIKFRPKLCFDMEAKALPEASSKHDPRRNSNTSLNASESSVADRSGLKWHQKIRFFLNAPVIIFIYNCVSYIVFLLLYSYILLVKFTPEAMFSKGKMYISSAELVLIIWVATFFMEEVRQIIMTNGNKANLKLFSYINSIWNIMDVIALLTFIIGMVLRLLPIDTCPNQSCFTAARIIYGLDLMTFFFRVLHMFSVHKKLGPKLDMIGEMMVDLAYFVVILMVFIAAYGIATQAMLYPGSPFNISLVKEVLHRPYFQIFGELFLEEIEGEACPSTGCSEPTSQWFVPILLGVYILITNVLMLNLVIAMFSYTFGKIQEHTDEHWKFQRYFLIKEYYDRPPLPPPLITISHLFLIIRAFVKSCRCCSVTVDNVFRKELADAEIRQFILWENMHADEYVRHTHTSETECQEHRIKEINDRVESVSRQVNQIAEFSVMMQTGSQQPSTNYRLPPVLDDRLSYLEEQLQRTAKALNWIIDSLVENKLGSTHGRPELPDVDELREQTRKRRDEIKNKKKEEFEKMLERQSELHIQSRTKRYPAHDRTMIIERFHVPDDKVSWEIDWPDYSPVRFTDPEILEQPSYADIDLMEFSPGERPKLQFNAEDTEYNVDRRSFSEEKYNVIDGIPQNPRGRTGLCGRGVLGRWGPNHAGDPVVTRWHRDEKGNIVRESSKPVLEFVSVERSDNKKWSIPGGMLSRAKPQPYASMKVNFVHDPGKDMQHQLELLWATEQEVYKGYCDDPRNTDNAWIETVAVNYHDEEGTLLKDLELKAGNNVDHVRWQKINTKHSFHGAHLAILHKVALKHNAAF